MDSSDSKGRQQKEDPSPSVDSSAHSSNILQSSWIRRFICSSDEVDRILSGDRYHLLLHLNPLFLLVLYFVKEKVMNG
jgi:hypothetical protein